MTKLECPFFDGEVKIQVWDDEGNLKDEEIIALNKVLKTT